MIDREKDSMKLNELIEMGNFNIVHSGDNLDKDVTKPFCCDLLSIAMSKATAGCVWVTVMGNVNTLAVASLADVACILLAEGSTLDEPALLKAKSQDITVLSTNAPIFEGALEVYHLLHDTTNL